MENLLNLDVIIECDEVEVSGLEAPVMHIVAEPDIRLFARIFDTIHEGVIVSNAENNIEFVNPAFSMITGYTREDVSGKNMYMLYSGLMEEPLYRFMWHSINETGRWQGEMANIHKNGTS
ncbi:MAG: PAS domain S-box protein, partial [Candidatus Nitrotoga sp.]